MQRENQETEVNFLKERILNELVRYFFSPEIKIEAIFAPSELATDFASVPGGRGFVEGALKVLIPKQFPEYSAVAVSNGWQRYLRAYREALSRETTLGTRKRGIEPILTVNQEDSQPVQYGANDRFSELLQGWRAESMLRIDEINNSGNTTH